MSSASYSEKVEIMAGAHGTNGTKEKLTAEQLRKRGNELHDARRFSEAVDSYTKAIVSPSNVSSNIVCQILCFRTTCN